MSRDYNTLSQILNFITGTISPVRILGWNKQRLEAFKELNKFIMIFGQKIWSDTVGNKKKRPDTKEKKITPDSHGDTFLLQLLL